MTDNFIDELDALDRLLEAKGSPPPPPLTFDPSEVTQPDDLVPTEIVAQEMRDLAAWEKSESLDFKITAVLSGDQLPFPTTVGGAQGETIVDGEAPQTPAAAPKRRGRPRNTPERIDAAVASLETAEAVTENGINPQQADGYTPYEAPAPGVAAIAQIYAQGEHPKPLPPDIVDLVAALRENTAELSGLRSEIAALSDRIADLRESI